MIRNRLIAALAGFVLVLTLNPALAERVALVVGNSDYVQVPRLTNPYNDASDIAAALETLGFDVDLVKNQDFDGMRRTLEAFQRKALRADVSLIYYAGHGLEVGKENYLIPVDAKLESDRAVRFEAISLDDMVFAAEGARVLSVVIVDACRDNPFRTRMARQDPTRSLGRGLAQFEPSQNSIVAYAARSGSVAFDGDGRNSPYAAALLDALAEPGLEVGLMFRKIRDSVLEQTNQQQEPWMYGTLSQKLVYLNPPDEVEEVPATVSVDVPEPEPGRPLFPTAGADLQYWLAIRDTADAAEFEEFLKVYPDSDFAVLARARLSRLQDSARGLVPVPLQDTALLGTPDAATAARVDPGPTFAEPAPSVVDLSREDARRLQARLTILGYNPGGADGVIGPNTTRAVTAYSNDSGLSGGGQITDVLVSRLETEVPDGRVDAYFNEIAAEERARRAAAASAAERTRRQAASSGAARTQRQAPAPTAQAAETNDGGSSWWPFSGGHEPRGPDDPFSDNDGPGGIGAMTGGR